MLLYPGNGIHCVTPPPWFCMTNAVVATFVELSPAVCVVAVVPLGSADAAIKLAADPVVFAALFGISPLTSAGNCVCGSVPTVISVALTVTFPDSACPFTVVVFGTYPASVDAIIAAVCTWLGAAAFAEISNFPSLAIPRDLVPTAAAPRPEVGIGLFTSHGPVRINCPPTVR